MRTREERRDIGFLNEEKVFPELHLVEEDAGTSDFWYIDNGASSHMTRDKEKFHELDKSVTGKVTFGDRSTIEIMGKGSIMFICKNGEYWLLQEVYYIPRLRSNLVSLGQLTEIGCRVVMNEDELKMYDKLHLQLIMKVKRSSNCLYRIKLEQARPVCMLMNIDDPAWL